MSYWESWAHVAPGMLKKISGGSLNGMTDINPVWRFQALTQAFGPCGFGWRIRETDRWKEEAVGEVAAFVKVELFINIGGTWSEPIEGVGGSKLVRKDKNGTNLSDEAWKMATTDAISVACKALGIAADVYTGKQSHNDQDQRRDGLDFGTKYESRNYGPGPVYASNGQPYQGQQLPRNPSKVCEVIDVQKGRARRLIAELARYDYDDPQSWAAGLAWLRNEVVLREGAEALIVQLAIEARNNAQQQIVNNVFRK